MTLITDWSTVLIAVISIHEKKAENKTAMRESIKNKVKGSGSLLPARSIKSKKRDNLVDPFAQNKEIQIEANTIIDFSESNPFGTP